VIGHISAKQWALSATRIRQSNGQLWLNYGNAKLNGSEPELPSILSLAIFKMTVYGFDFGDYIEFWFIRQVLSRKHNPTCQAYGLFLSQNP